MKDDELFAAVSIEVMEKIHAVLKEYVEAPVEMACALSIMIAHVAHFFGIPDEIVMVGVQGALKNVKEVNEEDHANTSGVLH